MTAEELTFEQALGNLEKLVEQMENGNLPLEQALKNYEMGVKLIKFCRSQIEATERKIIVLQQKDTGEMLEKEWPEQPE